MACGGEILHPHPWSKAASPQQHLLGSLLLVLWGAPWVPSAGSGVNLRQPAPSFVTGPPSWVVNGPSPHGKDRNAQ